MRGGVDMFCSECGTEIKEGAKFCYNCGAKLTHEINENEKKTQKVNTNLIKEYSIQINTQILERYLNGEYIKPDFFYKKARLYDMTQEMVDKVYDQEQQVIDHLNLYLDDISDHAHKLYIFENKALEFQQYGMTLGINEELCVSFWNNYMIRHEIPLKQEFFSYILEEYAETGEILKTVPSKYSTMQSLTSEEFLKYSIERINKMELAVAEEYKKSSNNLSEGQWRKLLKSGYVNLFLPEHMKNLIRGFEKKTGIKEHRENERKERVYARLREEFEDKYYIFGEEKVFSAKYFWRFFLENELEAPEEELMEAFEKMSKSSSDAPQKVQNLFNSYKEKFREIVCEWEDKLEIKVSVEVNDYCQGIYDKISRDIKYLYQQFGEIQEKVNDNNERRKEIKDNRGRWEGGGFGVGGAIKGAATASAMNAASGMLYSGAGLIGGAISGIGASINREKEVKSMEYAFSKLSDISSRIIVYFCVQIHIQYPEIYFDPYMEDTVEEAELRKKMQECDNDQKKDICCRLLQINPANWKNGISIVSEPMGTVDFWDEKTENSFQKLNDIFGWMEDFKDEIDSLVKDLDKVKKDIKNWELVDENLYNRLKEMVELAQKVTNDNPALFKDSAATQSLLVILNMMDEIKVYHNTLNNIDMMSKEEVFKIGNQYYINEGWKIGRKVFLKAINDNPEFEDILDNFQCKNQEEKNKAIKLTESWIQNKENIDMQQYKRALFILANLKDQYGKTMLVYAAEIHNKLVLEELIRNGADVDILKHLLDRNYNTSKNNVTEDYKICASCKKRISINAKFCNYCGKKC